MNILWNPDIDLEIEDGQLLCYGGERLWKNNTSLE